jgi:hypothetical protein
MLEACLLVTLQASPVVLYRYETYSFCLMVEHKLSIFKNRMLGRIFRAKIDELTEGW